jgi:hypothetical protein
MAWFKRTEKGITTATEEDFTYTTMNTAFGAVKDRNYAQSFTTGTAGILTEVQLYVNAYLGSPSTTFYLYSDSAGSPNASVGTIGTVYGLSLGRWIWFVLTCNITVTGSTKYWIATGGKGLYHGTLYGDVQMAWGGDSAGGYASQTLKYIDSGGSWTDSGDDANFKAYIQPSPTVDYDLDVTYKKRYV